MAVTTSRQLTCILTTFLLLTYNGLEAQSSKTVDVDVRFLVAVNATWQDNCVTIVPTPYLKSNTAYNDTPPITIGNCDQGTLLVSVTQPADDDVSQMEVLLQFFSYNSIYLRTAHCSFSWNATYIPPLSRDADVTQSPLPGCHMWASWFNWHLTGYWFWVLDWKNL